MKFYLNLLFLHVSNISLFLFQKVVAESDNSGIGDGEVAELTVGLFC